MVADIFISYAREDAVRAHELADAFVSLGWTVWWDDSLGPSMTSRFT
jgi:hypothetical protein